MVDQKLLSKDEILKNDDLPVERVFVKEWGGTVGVRGLTADERDLFDQMINKDGKVSLFNIRAKLVALTVINENGERMFSDADAESIGKKNGKAVQKIFSVARRLSGLRDEDLDEMKKNSDGATQG